YLEGVQGTPKIIADVLDRPPDEAGTLAGKIVSAEPSVAVFGVVGGRIIIARSPSLDLDAAALLRRILEPRGGRGGGRPEFAQGALAAETLREAVESARVELRRMFDA
ncbi:MAG TPA: DHHA1 domain-containing protein, partial [bacterium]|nr:DHHA1 domain-containing protein [bacterium]